MGGCASVKSKSKTPEVVVQKCGTPNGFSSSLRRRRRSLSRDYELKAAEVLGSGMNGCVSKAIHRDSREPCAVKRLPKSLSAKSELEANKRLQHKHIAKLIEFYEDESHITMMVELCSGGELFDHLDKNGAFPEANAARILRQVLLAVSYMHSQGFVHTDLKLENILYASEGEDSDVKLIDLGLCQRWSGSQFLCKKVGSPGYMAPEVIRGSYTNKCDLFSIGVIAFTLLSDRTPFGMGEDADRVEERTVRGQYKFGPAFKGVSDLAKNFIERLLTVDPRTRMSADEALQHPWLESYAFQASVQKEFGCATSDTNFIELPSELPDLLPRLHKASLCVDTNSEPSTREPSTRSSIGM